MYMGAVKKIALDAYLSLLLLINLRLKVNALITGELSQRTDHHVFQFKGSKVRPLMEETRVILGFSWGKGHLAMSKCKTCDYLKDLQQFLS